MYKSQYGFREAAHSTGLALMELIKDITSNLENNLVTIGVFIDLKKAFDTIDHSILIMKLCHFWCSRCCFKLYKRLFKLT